MKAEALRTARLKYPTIEGLDWEEYLSINQALLSTGEPTDRPTLLKRGILFGRGAVDVITAGRY